MIEVISTMKRGVVRLPYDAEVEYLESDGNQRINLGVQTADDITIEAEFKRTDDLTATHRVMGAEKNWGNNSLGLWTIERRISARRGTNSEGTLTSAGFTPPSVYDRVKAANTPLGLVINDGAVIPYSNTPVIAGGLDIWLFTLNRIEGRVDQETFVGKIYSARVWNGDGLLRDLIPVRVGNVGYMYDRVSKTRFGNDGTGSFGFGNDVALPIFNFDVAPSDTVSI